MLAKAHCFTHTNTHSFSPFPSPHKLLLLKLRPLAGDWPVHNYVNSEFAEQCRIFAYRITSNRSFASSLVEPPPSNKALYSKLLKKSNFYILCYLFSVNYLRKNFPTIIPKPITMGMNISDYCWILIFLKALLTRPLKNRAPRGF